MKRIEVRLGDRVLIPCVEVAETARQRMRGLLGRSGLEAGSGMLLKPCGSIHTLGMRFSLDLLFLDRDLCICRKVRDVRPWRMAWGGHRAHAVIEMASGWFDLDGVEEGCRLELAPVRG